MRSFAARPPSQAVALLSGALPKDALRRRLPSLHPARAMRLKGLFHETAHKPRRARAGAAADRLVVVVVKPALRAPLTRPRGGALGTHAEASELAFGEFANRI